MELQTLDLMLNGQIQVHTGTTDELAGLKNQLHEAQQDRADAIRAKEDLGNQIAGLNTQLSQAKQAKQANVRGHLLPRLVPHIAWPTSDGREMLS